MASSSTTLSHRVIFGINGNVTDNISFIEDDTLVYVAGQNVVIYNKTERKQRFIYGSEKSDGVTAFTAGSGKRYKLLILFLFLTTVLTPFLFLSVIIIHLNIGCQFN